MKILSSQIQLNEEIMQTNQFVSVYDAMSHLEKNWANLTKPQKIQYERLVRQRIRLLFLKQSVQTRSI